MLISVIRRVPHLLILSGLVVAQVASAFTLVMDNGDLITGDFVREDSEKVVMLVDYMGEVTLPKERIENLDKLHESFEKEDEQKVFTGIEMIEEAIDATKQEGKKNGDQSDHFMEGYVQFLSGLMPFHSWKKRLQLGVTTQSGRENKKDVYYRFAMNNKAGLNQYNVKAEYVYGKSNENKTADKAGADFQWRRDISPGVFYQTKSIYSQDDIKLISSNLEQTIGLGTRFIDNKSMVLSSGLGTSGRWRSFVEDEDEVVYLFNLFQDWDYRISERLRLTQDFNISLPLDEDKEYEYKLTAALVSELTKTINVSLRFEYGYDNSLDEDVKSDRRFVSSLGYTF